MNEAIIADFDAIPESTMNSVKKNVYNSLISISKQQDYEITVMVAGLISNFFELMPEKSTKLRKICEYIVSDKTEASKNFILQFFCVCCSGGPEYIYKSIGDIFCDIAINEIRNCTKLTPILKAIAYSIGVDKNDSGIFYQILEEILSNIKKFESVSIS